MKTFRSSNVPDVFKPGTPPDTWTTKQCLLDFVSVFSEKDLITLGINQRSAVDLGFLYAKEVANLPTPFIQNSLLYFFWFLDRNMHRLKPCTAPRSKIRCHLLFLAAEKTCRHTSSHAVEPCPLGQAPIPKARTSSSMRKKIVTKSPSLPDVTSVLPITVEISTPVESIETEAAPPPVAENREIQVETPPDEPVVVEPVEPSPTSAPKKKKKKKSATEAHVSPPSTTESSGSTTPKRKNRRDHATLTQQVEHEALDIGVRVKQFVREYVPIGEKLVTSGTLLSFVTMPDPVGMYVVSELLGTANLCDEYLCRENAVGIPSELVQAIEMVASKSNPSLAAIPPLLVEDARKTIKVFESCSRPDCPLKLFVKMLQRLK